MLPTDALVAVTSALSSSGLGKKEKKKAEKIFSNRIRIGLKHWAGLQISVMYF